MEINPLKPYCLSEIKEILHRIWSGELENFSFEDVDNQVNKADKLANDLCFDLHEEYLEYSEECAWEVPHACNKSSKLRSIFDFEIKKSKPEWLIEMSIDFIKSIKKIDKKLKGRILDAISELSRSPNQPKGNTIAPLKRELNGLWRIRVGKDHRVIYKADKINRTVTLLAYMPRGADYKPHHLAL